MRIQRRQLIALSFLPFARGASAQSSAPHSDLEEIVDLVDLAGQSGALMVALVEPDGTVTHASRGTDPAGNAPVPDDTFRIGSITKPVTATLVLTLVDDGAIELDRAASDWVTRVALPDGVTVRHLLQHTSGIPNYTDIPEWLDLVSDDFSRAWTPEALVALVADQEPQFAPGATWAYSNTNFVMLGILIEEVTGRPYHDVLRERILDPLHLDRTWLAAFEEGPEPFGAFATFDSEAPAPITFDYTSIATGAWAAGGLVSSPADLHVVFRELFAGNVIDSNTVAEMIAPNPHDYGLGMGFLTLPGVAPVYGHNGGIPGYASIAAHSRETGRTGFWVATNEQIDVGPTIEPVVALLTRQ